MIRFCLFLLPSLALASIFDTDDRLEYYQIKDTKIKEISSSSAALVKKNKMLELPNGDFKMIGIPLEEEFKFCPDANFAKQARNANCSAALVGKDEVLTAAHCFDALKDDQTSSFNSYYVVFDYKNKSDNLVEFIIPKENVYTIKKEKYFNFDRSMHKTTIDLAIIKLDRQVPRVPIKVNTKYEYQQGNEVFVLGYPMGIPLKLTPNGFIDPSPSPNSFRHDLDTFSVNSGSPVFDALSYEIIGVHVRGTGWNYAQYGQECFDWFRAQRGKDYGEANTVHILDGKI